MQERCQASNKRGVRVAGDSRKPRMPVSCQSSTTYYLLVTSAARGAIALDGAVIFDLQQYAEKLNELAAAPWSIDAVASNRRFAYAPVRRTLP